MNKSERSGIKAKIVQLCANRLMKNDEQLNIYEQSLDEIGDNEDVANIPALCFAFDDETEHREVMSGLIPIIEGYNSFSSREEQLKYFIKGAPNMLPQASDWLRTMLVRILNHDESRKLFRELLAGSSDEAKVAVRAALQNISKEDPAKFKAKVDEVV